MEFELAAFEDNGLSGEYLAWLITSQSPEVASRRLRLWHYYRNELIDRAMTSGHEESSRPYRQAQEYGLPSRITATRYSSVGGPLEGASVKDQPRKEVVVENDIGWRIDTLVDFLFGKPLVMESTAADASRARQIEALLKTLFEVNGGQRFFQQMALLGSVYGFVDVLLRTRGSLQEGQGDADAPSKPIDNNWSRVLQKVRLIGLETIEAPRVLPVLAVDDYQDIRYYVQHYLCETNQLSEQSAWSRWWRGARGPRQVSVVELLGPRWWQRYEDGRLIEEGPCVLGRVPVVHIQNFPLPLSFEGLSDVEPLIPLQDELNTRLSDRANRVTFQSFKMYLGKGISDFLERKVGPGQMWKADDPDAGIEEFGGDTACPSEQDHVKQIREALDKVSGVTPVAAGVIEGKIGNLTSAVALRITLMGLLSKTERKRQVYGKGIREVCRMVLELLDASGVWATRPEEREIKIHWPSPLPENLNEKLDQARQKHELGVSRETVLRELGYEFEDGTTNNNE